MTQQTLFATKKDWTTALPIWLAENLDTVNNREPKNDQVELAPCPRCTQPILRAWDIFTWRIDPTALTNRQELVSLTMARQTFTLSIDTFKHLEIAYRGAWTIRNQPSNTTETFTHPDNRGRKQIYVIPEHACHRPLGEPIEWTTLYKQPKEHTNNDQPPF